jgi:MFS family permease
VSNGPTQDKQNVLGEFPKGLAPLYWFSALNALSFQPVLSSPMVLYAKSLGASATVLGVLAGMMPFLVISQLPAAKHINRVGYRRFVLAGWTTRVTLIFFMAAVPLCGGFLDTTTRLVLILTLLFGFNLFRGISSAAWLPWIMELVPMPSRGRHFARDQFCANGASVLAFAFCGVVLGFNTGWGFPVVFGFAALAGAISLPVLKAIPDMPPPPDTDAGVGPVPWLEMASHPPFRKLLHVNAAWSLAYGGLTTFVVKYLKDGAGWHEDMILYFMSLSFVGGLLSPWLAGPRLDRLGSKPILTFTMVLGFLIAAGWWMAAAGVLQPGRRLVLPLMAVLGLINALFSAANNRLALHLAPRMGRNHFFAIFMVVWQITLGLSPVFWGLFLDAIGGHKIVLLGVEWNRFSDYFALVGVCFVVAFGLSERLVEPNAAEVQALVRELLLKEPRRWWTLVTGR